MDSQRINILLKKLNSKKLDGFLIKKKENIAYLSGYHGRNCILVVTPEKSFFITDSRYKEEAESCIKGGQIFITRPGESPLKIIKSICKKNRIKRLAFESKYFSFSDYERLKALLNSTILLPEADLLERLREIKTDEEIEHIRNASRIAIKAINYAKKILKPGIEESRVAAEIEYFIKTNGASDVSFPVIVASGARTSLPHAKPTGKRIKAGEIVLIDLGALSYEYASDLTRAMFLGKINQDLKKIYKAVLSAQKAAIEYIRPGVLASILDRIARQYLKKFSLEKYFLHSLGHGIGREVHERPFISQKSKERIKPGMVFTVEPGIYIPGFGGIRIEDVVAVTEDGFCVLTEGASHYVN